MYNATQKVIKLDDNREIIIETGKLAKQADGAVVVKQGDTMLLATVVAAKDAKPDTDFMPLQVDYKEKYASSNARLVPVTTRFWLLVLLTVHFVRCSRRTTTPRFSLP